MNPLRRLIGLPLWRTRHLGSARGLDFGDRVPTVSRRGEPGIVPGLALHLQCPWRFVDSAGTTLADDDSDPVDATARLERCLGERGLIVLAARLEPSGAFQLQLDGARVEATPCGDEEHELWRLFAPATTGEHFVHYVGRHELE